MRHDDYSLPYEAHLHADILLRPGVTPGEIEDALRPLWHYAGAKSLKAAAKSMHPEERGIEFDAAQNTLHLCWTLLADEGIRHAMEELTSGSFNELCAEGARIELSIHDLEFDEDSFDPEDETAEGPRDSISTLYFGPSPAHVLAVQKQDLEAEVIEVMSDMFEEEELGEVREAIERLFTKRLDALNHALEGIARMGLNKSSKIDLSQPFSGSASGARRPRRLH